MRLSSPFFTASGKKRGEDGGASENPDPSSPKVTCIGQVRVKSKRKKDTQFRSLSRRRSGESSFRKTEHRRHQRWVHLPISACEALRAFNSCMLFPCCRGGSSPSSSCAGGRDDGGCGAVVARWMVFSTGPVRETAAAGGGGDSEAAEEDGEEEEEEMQRRCSRRHVFEDIEVRNGKIKVKGVEEDEERGRVSICVPPKNALLLMRFRSDPVKMATVVNRCLFDCEDDDEDEEIADSEIGEKEIFVSIVESIEESNVHIEEEIPRVEDEDEEEEEMESNMSSFEALLHGGENEDEKENSDRDDVVSKEEREEEEEDEQALPECLLLMMCEPKLSMEVSKETWVRSADFIRWMPAKAPAGGGGCEHHQVTIKRRPSVEGAKAKIDVADVPAPARRSDRHLVQPARSSCSLPAASVASVKERRLRGNEAGAFALSRCKSEPRTAAAKLMPETCFWKGGGAAGVGVGGAAEVGI